MECPTQTLFQMFQSYNICKYRIHEPLCGLLWKQVSVYMHVICSHVYMYLHTQVRVGGWGKPASNGWFHSPWVLQLRVRIFTPLLSSQGAERVRLSEDRDAV